MSVPNWTLRIKDFGPIGEANVKLAPLTILAGHNNTGKSYLTTLLWSLLSDKSNLFDYLDPAWPEYRKAAAWIKKKLPSESWDIEGKDWKVFVDLLNKLVSSLDSKFLSELFGHNIKLWGQFLLTGASDNQKMTIKASKRPSDSIFTKYLFEIGSSSLQVNSNYYIHFEKFAHTHGERWQAFEISSVKEESVIGYILLKCLKFILVDAPDQQVAYFPAARTGLVVTRQLLNTVLIGLSLRNRSNPTSFPLPVRDFIEQYNAAIQSLSGDGKLFGLNIVLGNDELFAAATALEKILRGSPKIVSRRDPDMHFKPNGMENSLALHVSSSMVTELMPFLIMLKSRSFVHSTIIFEEPESHLHLAAQRDLAKAVATMINLGFTFIITTHGDTFLQQLNILIRASQYKDDEQFLKELGLESDQLINPELVTGYYFDDSGNKTVVIEMKKTECGLEDDSMNKEIIEMTESILKMDEKDMKKNRAAKKAS